MSIRSTHVITFRVNKTLKLMLGSKPYSENKAILLRLLLAEYFAGNLPLVKAKFEAAIKPPQPGFSWPIRRKNIV
jgi:hypothetical protein